MSGLSFKARETVFIETPARSAMSSIVTRSNVSPSFTRRKLPRICPGNILFPNLTGPPDNQFALLVGNLCKNYSGSELTAGYPPVKDRKHHFKFFSEVEQNLWL